MLTCLLAATTLIGFIGSIGAVPAMSPVHTTGIESRPVFYLGDAQGNPISADVDTAPHVALAARAAGDVRFEVTTPNVLCVRMIKPSANYNQNWCLQPSQFGTCFTWKEIVQKPRLCVPDGAFCYDFFDNGYMEIMESAITYTVSGGYAYRPASVSFNCNYYTGKCNQDGPGIYNDNFCKL